MIFGFCVSPFRALHVAPDRLSNLSAGGRNHCRALLLARMNCFVSGCVWCRDGSQLDLNVNGVGEWL